MLGEERWYAPTKYQQWEFGLAKWLVGTWGAVVLFVTTTWASGPQQEALDLTDELEVGRAWWQDFADFYVEHPVIATIMVAAVVFLFGRVSLRRKTN